MSDTTEKIETKAFNVRAKLDDHVWLTEILKDYDPKHVGLTHIINLAKNRGLPSQDNSEEIETLQAEILDLKTQLENQPIKEVHQNLNDLFEFDEYVNFTIPSDLSILEPIKRGLQAANDSLKQSSAQTPTKTVADFVPQALVDKVNLLHRDLRMKNKIPESTQAEYLEQLLIHSLKYFLLNEYPNIYNR